MGAYRIPAEAARIEVQVKNSRFIATAGRTDTVEAAKAMIHAVRAEMPGANHHVYAFRVGHGASVTEGVSDDGEPSGTSGPPVLAVVRGSDIGDITVVITRFFGGTKLGTGGLVSAYSESARQVLAVLRTEEKVERKTVHLTFPYTAVDRMMRLLQPYAIRDLRQTYQAEVVFSFQIAVDALPALQAQANDLLCGAGRWIIEEKKGGIR